MLTHAGNFWICRSEKTGELYFSGNIKVNGKAITLVLFKNKNQRTERDADYSAFRATLLKTKKPPSSTKKDENEGEIQYMYG